MQLETSSTGLKVMNGFFGSDLQGLSRTEKLGIVAALVSVCYQVEYSEDWTVQDELDTGNYEELSPQVKGAIGFCTAILLKLSMHGGDR